MTRAKVTDEDCIQFLLATLKVCSATEAARVQADGGESPAHDAFTRLLHRLEPDVETLGKRPRHRLNDEGVFGGDDSMLDKPSAEKVALVQRHWSAKHHAMVEGINLLTLLWTDGDRHVPLDYRVYNKARDGLTKNNHFRALLETAYLQGFVPECGVFDSWNSGLENLKQIRDWEWT
ncbi:MAG: hypothetical protein WAT67_08425 [Candidatus Contendobacter sp.]